MKRKTLIKGLKLFLLLLLLLVGVLLVLFYRFSQPKIKEKIIEEFKDKGVGVYITNKKFRDFSYQTLNFQKEIDTTKFNLVFVHGSIGSATDFSSYCADSILLSRANIRTYDRIGYGLENTGIPLESIAEETLHLEQVIDDLDPGKTILVGYSYGGPVVLNTKREYKKIVLIAPAVHAASEPMPWAINFYKWKWTRWMIPATWKAASREKLSHREDLKNFENQWATNTNSILSIHGDDDGIVPIENSYFLQEKFSAKQFEMLTLSGAGHGLVWSRSDIIIAILRDELKK